MNNSSKKRRNLVFIRIIMISICSADFRVFGKWSSGMYLGVIKNAFIGILYLPSHSTTLLNVPLVTAFLDDFLIIGGN